MYMIKRVSVLLEMYWIATVKIKLNYLNVLIDLYSFPFLFSRMQNWNYGQMDKYRYILSLSLALWVCDLLR